MEWCKNCAVIDSEVSNDLDLIQLPFFFKRKSIFTRDRVSLHRFLDAIRVNNGAEVGGRKERREFEMVLILFLHLFKAI